MKKILITGGAGFIGTNFIKHICNNEELTSGFEFIILDALTYSGRIENIQEDIEKNPRLHFIRGDIRDPNLINQIFDLHQFQGCLNFAAESHVDRSIQTPALFVETNVLGTLNLLRASLDLWNKNKEFRFLQVSTDEVYGSLGPDDAPFTETHPILPNSPYSASKAGADCLVRSFHETYGLPTIITRCSNNFGPFQYEEKFIPVIIKNALKNQKIPVYGTGANVRDWIYVDDHNEGIWSAFTRGKSGEVYNFGGNQEIQNIELVKLILQGLGQSDQLISFVSDRLGHDHRYAINFTKATRELGWIPKTTFQSGLESTLIWYHQIFNK